MFFVLSRRRPPVSTPTYTLVPYTTLFRSLARLHRVLDPHAPLLSVAEQRLEHLLLVRRVDDQHLADACQHQHAERVIYHRFVVDRQQLLADRLGDRIQPRTRAAGENDAAARRHATLPMRSSR